MRLRPFRVVLHSACALAALFPVAALAQIQLPLHLADGAVVQRDREVPVWGRAAPRARVRVAFAGAERTARADAAGQWRVDLPAAAVGGPYELTVSTGDERVVVRDVLVGDVWIASGQSNMEWTVADAHDAAAEIAAPTDRTIRHFKVPQAWAEAPLDTLAGGRWEAMSPETVGRFSAVATFFSRTLREHTDVPIGILNTSWGGSRIEPWMPAAALGLDATATNALFAAERGREEAVFARVTALTGALPTRDEGLVDGVAVWAAPGLDDAAWATIRVPAQWESEGYDGMDGTAWYRTTFDLTPAEAADGVMLGLGRIDDSDQSWVNGVAVGGMEDAWTVARVYAVSASALRVGRNVVAVRVVDTQGGGGVAGDPSEVYVETVAGRRPLGGQWRFRVAEARLRSVGGKNQVPTVLWNAMVAPLLPSPVAGVLWYQGESNADTEADAVAYRDLFPALIRSWRAASDGAWGDVPFLWVQLANYHAPPRTPDDPAPWAILREAQTAALALPRTAQAVAIDAGEADDIHPRDKQTVGRRLALAARRLAYGEPELAASGPTFRSYRVDGGTVVVSFGDVGGGLRSRGGGPLGGFALVGADGRWAWAAARIDGNCVNVSSPDVSAPVAVRYAWADNPDRATLTNAEGLPAGPFRAGPDLP